MSEPKRYDVGMTTEFNPHGFNHSFPRVYESEQGRYVEYEDYARLKAAFDLLDESIKLGPSTIPLSHGYYIWKESEQYALKAENARLKADIERLTKAGDAMAKLMFIDKDYIGSPKQEAVVEWCKATEGKQS